MDIFNAYIIDKDNNKEYLGNINIRQIVEQEEIKGYIQLRKNREIILSADNNYINILESNYSYSDINRKRLISAIKYITN